ncbi:Cell division protein FtsZ, partial [hydrothermal vent metagenome]
LMEVDEAANHIRELVDPDANIIWGSAFNENLDGRIRVSVVATGIDNDGSVAAPVPTASFAMGAPEPVAESQPSSFASTIETQTDDMTEENEAVEETVEEESPMATSAPATSYDDDNPEDDVAPAPSFASLTPGMSDDEPEEEEELVLGDENIEPVAEVAATYSDDPETDEPAPRVASGGGTLFERMSNLTRGGSKSDENSDGEEEKPRDPLDIPRFLNRQNNQ